MNQNKIFLGFFCLVLTGCENLDPGHPMHTASVPSIQYPRVNDIALVHLEQPRKASHNATHKPGIDIRLRIKSPKASIQSSISPNVTGIGSQVDQKTPDREPISEGKLIHDKPTHDHTDQTVTVDKNSQLDSQSNEKGDEKGDSK